MTTNTKAPEVISLETRLAIRQTFIDWEHTAKQHVADIAISVAWKPYDVDRLIDVLSCGALPRCLVAEVIDDLVYDGILSFTYQGNTQYVVRA